METKQDKIGRIRMEKDWNIINKEKNNVIMANMAKNLVAKARGGCHAILDNRDKFKEDVKEIYKLFKEIDVELRKDGELV